MSSATTSEFFSLWSTMTFCFEGSFLFIGFFENMFRKGIFKEANRIIYILFVFRKVLFFTQLIFFNSFLITSRILYIFLSRAVEA